MPEEKNEMSNAFKASEWIYRTFLLTVAFFLFSLMGLVIFGFGPALKANQKILLDWQDQNESPFFKTYFTFFKKDYLKALLTSLLYLLIIAGTIVLYIFVIHKIENQTAYGILLVLDIVVFVFGLTGMSFVYYFVNKYETSYLSAIRFSFTIVWGRFLGVVENFLLIIATIIIMPLLPFLFMGIYTILNTKIADHMFFGVDPDKIRNY